MVEEGYSFEINMCIYYISNFVCIPLERYMKYEMIDGVIHYMGVILLLKEVGHNNMCVSYYIALVHCCQLYLFITVVVIVGCGNGSVVTH